MKNKSLVLLLVVFLSNCIQINMPLVDEYITILLSLAGIRRAAAPATPVPQQVALTIIYPASPYTLTLNTPIAQITPTVTGTITSCTASPVLPAGLVLDNATCGITGTPTAAQPALNYVITAANTTEMTNATATISIAVSAASYTVGGTVSGLVGTLVLQNNGGDNKSITANGAFTFTTPIISGGTYAVTALTQPSGGYYCSVTGGTGTVTANVTTVAISCTISWSAPTMPSDGFRMDVTYANGLFVAVAWGSNQVATSPDGITWTARTIPSNKGWMSVTYGNGKFVAVGWYNNIAMSSPDGITWTDSTMPSDGSGDPRWHSVTFGNGLFVATSIAPSSVAATSTDGITWTARTLPTSSSWGAVSFGNGLFLLPSSSSNILSSSNGITWTARTMPSSQTWSSVDYGNGKYVAVAAGPSNAAASSSDGITWTAMTLPASHNWSSVGFGNGRFIAVTNSGTICASLP